MHNVDRPRSLSNLSSTEDVIELIDGSPKCTPEIAGVELSTNGQCQKCGIESSHGIQRRKKINSISF